MKLVEGIILKCVGGLYSCLESKEDGGCVYPCSARGVFRQNGITPSAGDNIRFSVSDSGNRIEEVLPRRSYLIRPPLANVEILAVVVSAIEPMPNPMVIDKMITVSEYSGIEPVIIFNKTDLGETDILSSVYASAGFRVFTVSAKTGDGIDNLRSSFNGKFCAFAGNSGVGKSSLLNAIDPAFGLATAEISKKLNRGRHTTRVTELFARENGGFFADTPGFSSFEIERVLPVGMDEAAGLFREFLPFTQKCRFNDCMHLKETGCAVIAAVTDGLIHPLRYRSYAAICEELSAIHQSGRRYGRNDS